MKPFLIWLLLFVMFGSADGLIAQTRNESWAKSLVSLEVTQKSYDYLQPWLVRTRDERGKNGLVLGPKAVLTTAKGLNDATLVRIQTGGRGRWFNGRIAWIDYHADLAIVEPEDEDLLEGFKPVTLAASIGGVESKAMQVLRWNNGKLEARKAEFNEFTVTNGELSFVPHVHLLLSSELDSSGRAEVVIADDEVVGIVSVHGGSISKVIPAPFVRALLEAKEKGTYGGLSFFDFVWQSAENPAILEYLKLEGEPRGVVVIDIPSKLGQKQVLKKRDVLLEVAGFPIDTQGDYKDPDYGYLSLEGLSNRGQWAGDTIRLKVWREGEALDLDYTLPKAHYSEQLVPDQVFDQEPEYLVVGGLVFVPLTDAFLRLWGEAARRRAPFRLSYYNQQEASEEQPALVILSMLLPDPVNLGYQDYRYLVLNKLNGRDIRRLHQLPEALEHPDGGFHVFEFMEGSQVSRMVLDAEETGNATRRVLERYGIPSDRHFVQSLR